MLSIVAAATIGALTFSGVTAATAAVPAEVGPGIAITGVMDRGTTWLGAVGGTAEAEASGWLSWCITAGLVSPQGVPMTSVSYVDDPQLAWVVQAYEHVETDVSRAAIAYLTHTRHETGSSGVSAETRIARIIANTPQSVKDTAADYLAQAAAHAGPYSAAPGSVEGAGTRTGAIWVSPLISSAGVSLAGLPMTVTLNGPAVFESTGTNVWTGTTPAERTALAWVATGNGEVTWSYSYSGLPRQTMTRLSADGEVQDTLTYGLRSPSDPEELVVPGPRFDVVVDFQPEIRTQVATTFVGKGEALVDQVTVAPAAGDTWPQVNGSNIPLTAKGTLYGPYASQPAQSATVPAGAPVAGTASLTFNGPSTQEVASSSVASGSGYYTWVWTISKADQGEFAQYIRGDAAHDFGMVVETHIVPFQPVVTTVVQDRVVEIGGSFVDEVTFGTRAGDMWMAMQDGSPVETVWDGVLYGPFPEPTPEVAATPSGAPIAARTTLRASGPGVQSTDAAATASAPGFYTWVWEMDRAKQPVAIQPYLAGSFRDAFMIEDETSTVRHTASVTSLVREFNVVQGGQIHDTITVTGIPDYYGDFPGLGGWVPDVGEIVHTAYGPLRNQPTDDLDLDTAPVLGVATTPAKNGVYLIGMDGEFQVAADNSAAGWYVIVSSFPGDDRLEAFQTSPGDVMEMAFVPFDRDGGEIDTFLITDADEQVAAGQPFKDTAYLTGTIHEGGYLEFEAYGPFVEDEEPVESDEMLLWTSAQIPVPAAGTYRSGYTTTDLPDEAAWGDVFWVATYYTADGEQVVRGAFGDPSEITRVVRPETPLVTTLAQPMVALGDPATDVAYVSGPVTPESTLTFAAYLQDEGDDVELDELVFDTADEPLVIFHGGAYESAPVVFETAGTYYWVETLRDPAGEVVHVGEPRLPNETTLVVEVSTEAVKQIVAGGQAHDVATIAGTALEGSTLSFEVYRQDAGIDVARDELVATLDAVEVTGPEVISSEVTLEEPGTYYWVETLYDPDGEVVHVGAPRLPNETTLVVRVTTQALEQISAGEAAHDVALVEGPVLEGSTLDFEVYRQDTGDDVALDELVTTLAPVPVTGPGEIRSGDVSLEAPGTYYWVETLYDPDGEVVHVGAPRLANETTRVVAAAEALAAAADSQALASTGLQLTALWVALTLTGIGIGVVSRTRATRATTRP